MGPLLDEAVDVLKGMFTDDSATPSLRRTTGNPASSDVTSVAKTVPAKPPVSQARPEKTIPPAQMPDRETPVSPAGNGSSLLEQAAHVNDPKEETYAPLLQWAADFISSALGEDSYVHGKNTIGPSDESMGLAYRAGGEAVREAAQRHFVESSSVNAQGEHPPGPLDESMAELEKTGFENMQHQAVADTHELIGEKEGFTYEPDIGTVEADAFGVGIKMVPLQIESTILSLGATIGRFLFELFGGAPIGLEKTEARVQEL